jgi:4-diphosphocytidyl-2C-methyl-D-erythritol kinase
MPARQAEHAVAARRAEHAFARRAEHAFAKVNLYLHIIGRRADGYHLLDSLVVFAGAADLVEAAEADALGIELQGPGGAALAAEPDNLVLRAARSLAAAAGVPPHAALRLTKNLPVAAGLGGGSADAAAALRALSALWGLGWAPARLRDVAAGLGADVPVCVDSVPARMSGIGEVLEPAPAPAALRPAAREPRRAAVDARRVPRTHRRLRGAGRHARGLRGRRGACRLAAGPGQRAGGAGPQPLPGD